MEDIRGIFWIVGLILFACASIWRYSCAEKGFLHIPRNPEVADRLRKLSTITGTIGWALAAIGGLAVVLENHDTTSASAFLLLAPIIFGITWAVAAWPKQKPPNTGGKFQGGSHPQFRGL